MACILAVHYLLLKKLFCMNKMIFLLNTTLIFKLSLNQTVFKTQKRKSRNNFKLSKQKRYIPMHNYDRRSTQLKSSVVCYQIVLGFMLCYFLFFLFLFKFTVSAGKTFFEFTLKFLVTIHAHTHTHHLSFVIHLSYLLH